MPVVQESYLCIRYMPTFRFPVTGCRLKTSGRQMNGPPSSGQQVWIGRKSRLGFSRRITSLHGPLLTDFGAAVATRANFGTARSLSPRDFGMSSWISALMSRAMSSSFSTPSAAAMRRSEP